MALEVDIREKAFEGKHGDVSILSNVRCSVEPGEILCLYGPSGCGKSTLLRCIAGLDTDYVGEIALDGVPITRPSRLIGMTVQSDVSFNWLTVEENIAFGLRYLRKPRRWIDHILARPNQEEVRREARRLGKIVGLSEAELSHYPHELSGGMKQRMSFARALLPGPRVLLLDEPFSALEYESRHALQDVVLRVREELSTAFICVSHDPEEVVYLGDRILVMSQKPSTIAVRWDVHWNGTGKDRFVPAFLEKANKLRKSLREAGVGPMSESSMHRGETGPTTL